MEVGVLEQPGTTKLDPAQDQLAEGSIQGQCSEQANGTGSLFPILETPNTFTPAQPHVVSCGAAQPPPITPAQPYSVTAAQPHITAAQPHTVTATQPHSLAAAQPSTITAAQPLIAVVPSKPLSNSESHHSLLPTPSPPHTLTPSLSPVSLQVVQPSTSTHSHPPTVTPPTITPSQPPIITSPLHPILTPSQPSVVTTPQSSFDGDLQPHIFTATQLPIFTASDLPTVTSQLPTVIFSQPPAITPSPLPTLTPSPVAFTAAELPTFSQSELPAFTPSSLPLTQPHTVTPSHTPILTPSQTPVVTPSQLSTLPPSQPPTYMEPTSEELPMPVDLLPSFLPITCSNSPIPDLQLPAPLVAAVLESFHDDHLVQEIAQQVVANEYREASPLQLQANEELLSEDEMEDEATPTTVLAGTRPVPLVGEEDVAGGSGLTEASSQSARSDSASPYPAGDNDSFASFVAREAQETASALGDDQFSSSSHSPIPTPLSSHMDGDLVSHLPALPPPKAIVSQFGITANCPRSPTQLTDDATTAQLNMSTHNFPKRSKYAHRAAISAMHPYNRTRGGGASVAKTLDLLKAILQSSFNLEVKRLCDDYLQIFNVAAQNIRENTGDNVPDATLKLLVVRLLEEAQQGYQDGRWEFPTGKLPTNDKIGDAKGSPMSTKKAKTDKGEAKYGPGKRVRKAPADRHAEKNFGWRWGMDKRRVDPVKWEPDKLSLETDFVLGVNVNKALGHAANRGKVYYLHPELFKYACDGDDKTWLYENKHLPVHGGKAFLMVFGEVLSLVTTDQCYKDNPEVLVAVRKLQSFAVPQFMVDKMKAFMRSVQGYFAQEGSSTASTAAAAVDGADARS